MHSVQRSHPIRSRNNQLDHRRVGEFQAERTGEPRHRPRSGRLDGAQEARGVFLMALATMPNLIKLSHFTATGDELPLLRISTAGSVDDGKSTLIGRLL